MAEDRISYGNGIIARRHKEGKIIIEDVLMRGDAS